MRQLVVQIQTNMSGGEDLVPIANARDLVCPATRNGQLCTPETSGDRMVSDLAKRSSRRRMFGR
jgi:hypothetical protein